MRDVVRGDAVVPTWTARLERGCGGPSIDPLIRPTEGSLVHLAHLRVDRVELADGTIRSSITSRSPGAALGTVRCNDEPALAIPDARSIGWRSHVLGVRGYGELVALDPATATHAWTTSIGHAIEALEEAGGVVLAAGRATEEPSDPRLVLSAVDAESGAERWRRDLGRYGAVRELVTDGADCALVVREEGEIHRDLSECDVMLVDARTGEVIWRRGLPARSVRAPCSAAVDGDELAVASGAGVTLLDVHRGATLAESSARIEDHVDFALADGRVHALAPGAADDESELVALDARTGAVQWRGTLRGADRLAVVGAYVLATSASGVLHAHERVSGAQAWSFHVGEPFELIAAPPRAPRWAVLVARDGELAGIDLVEPSTRAPTPPTVIVGQLTDASLRRRRVPVRVRAGRSETTTDREGRFRLEVSGAGTVRVEVDTRAIVPARPVRDGCPYVEEPRVPLDGQTHRVEPRVRFEGCD